MPVGEKVAQMYRMSLFKQMIYCNTAVFRFRYESHANIGRRAVALAPKNTLQGKISHKGLVI